MIPGMPLIYSGQEAGLNKRLRFFEKDTIDWTTVKYHDFYTRLISMKKDHKPLWNGAYGAPMVQLENNYPLQVVSFARMQDDVAVIAIFNLSDEPVTGLKVKLNDFSGKMTQPLSGKQVELAAEATLNLEPWQYEVFVKE
ncbi:MAG: hypothetical protein R6V49_10160 [Bacteroidales bacterium]